MAVKWQRGLQPESHERQRRRAGWLTSPYLLLSSAAFFWSANMVVGRAARDLIPPIAFNFWRWALALLILLPFTWRGLLRERALIRREWRILGALALTGITVFHSFIYLGLALSPAINGLLLFATSPLFFVLLAWLMTGARITPGQALGILASIAGATLVIARGDLAVLLGLRLQLMPVFGALLATAFLGERLAGHHWLGGALVLSGIVLAWRR